MLGVGMDASAIAMTEMAGIDGMDGWLVTPAVWTPSYAALMFSMWWIMMVTMVLPRAAPMLETRNTWLGAAIILTAGA